MGMRSAYGTPGSVGYEAVSGAGVVARDTARYAAEKPAPAGGTGAAGATGGAETASYNCGTGGETAVFKNG